MVRNITPSNNISFVNTNAPSTSPKIRRTHHSHNKKRKPDVTSRNASGGGSSTTSTINTNDTHNRVYRNNNSNKMMKLETSSLCSSTTKMSSLSSSPITSTEKVVVSSEISLSQAIQNLLTNTRITDVTLVGNDGERVIGNKGMLAARSPVLESLLFDDINTVTPSPFTHNSNGHAAVTPPTVVTTPAPNEVSLDYSGKVIRAVVEYIYSDRVSLLERDNITTTTTTSNDDEEDVELSSSTILSLIDAASRFGLDELCNKALIYATQFIRTHPSQSVSWLAECCENCSLVTAAFRIKELVMKQIRQNPKLLLGENKDTTRAMSLLNKEHMEFILKDQKLRASEYTMFCILDKWARINGNNQNDNNDDIDDNNENIVTDDEIDDIVDAATTTITDDHDMVVCDTTDQQQKDNNNDTKTVKSLSKHQLQRLQDAKELSQHIAFHLIDPQDLNTIVANSGIITEKQLLRAYREQCESLSRKCGVSFKSQYRAGMEGFSFKNSKHGDLHLCEGRNGGGGVWKTDVVACPPLLFGNVYRWGMYIEEFVSTGDGLHLGVASTMNHHQLQYDKFLGFQEGGWTLCNKGYTYESNESVLRRDPKRCFERGVTLVFTLDLTARGSLKVSINGQPKLPLCENMLDKRVATDNSSTRSRQSNNKRRYPKGRRNNNPRIGFLPAVSTRVYGGRGIARIRFLGFE